MPSWTPTQDTHLSICALERPSHLFQPLLTLAHLPRWPSSRLLLLFLVDPPLNPLAKEPGLIPYLMTVLALHPCPLPLLPLFRQIYLVPLNYRKKYLFP